MQILAEHTAEFETTQLLDERRAGYLTLKVRQRLNITKTVKFRRAADNKDSTLQFEGEQYDSAAKRNKEQAFSFSIPHNMVDAFLKHLQEPDTLTVSLRNIRPDELAVDKIVYWADPDQNQCSGFYSIGTKPPHDLDEETAILLCNNVTGSTVEAFLNELYTL